MREIMTAQEWIAKGYPYVFEGTQGSFDFVLMDEYDFEDTNTKKPLLVKDGFDTEGYGLGPATARDIFDRIAGLEDVIRGLKKYRESQPCHKFDEDFSLVAKIFRTTGDTIWQLVDEYELEEETR